MKKSKIKEKMSDVRWTKVEAMVLAVFSAIMLCFTTCSIAYHALYWIDTVCSVVGLSVFALFCGLSYAIIANRKRCGFAQKTSRRRILVSITIVFMVCTLAIITYNLSSANLFAISNYLEFKTGTSEGIILFLFFLEESDVGMITNFIIAQFLALLITIFYILPTSGKEEKPRKSAQSS